ncbi:Putative folylpoly-gamma-glutamate synthetase [Elusimicrobium minutum Pei191]|uniref:Dihydrofolate synthase/folylpolyglutamate synthase n=1 Tax=Elusimicrobium minutum (strain Pei191) TaxID=445932 RepID=B2KDP8_ELUMP|nr:Mur ligase family protein [Elusimicrobium minutum]ACC98644.1 Putative folylpoly-gamma-glutamate synthetase [Elusimicrobium minutum Pei191]
MSFEAIYKKILKRHFTIKKEQNFNAVNFALFNLGSPHKKIKTVHIAGTNGKGSTAVMTANILSAAGFKTGLYTSPHIITPCERVKINGKNINKKSFAAAIKKVLAAEVEPLNYFEILTCAAFYYFAKNKVDYAVVETGLGGLMDATNVLIPVLTAVTSIDFDHKDILGGTIQKIAAQKAGIIKPGVPCVAGEIKGSAKKILLETAKKNKAPLYFTRGAKEIKYLKNGTMTAVYKNGKKINLKLLGYPQTINAAIAAKSARILRVKEKHIKTGIEKSMLESRFEIIKQKGKTLILDGGHNAEAAKNLIETYKNMPFYPNAELVFASSKDKEYGKIINMLAPHFSAVNLTSYPSVRAAAPKDIKACSKPVFYPKTKILSLKKLPCFDFKRHTLFCGSFYLTAYVKEKLNISR